MLLKKNIPNETNENSAKRLSKKTPREGSDAKEWTLFRMPDLTINDPRIESKKVSMPKNTIQERSTLFLLKIKECVNAVPANQGIKATFSTGSQNQYPPQPNSY